MRITKKSVSLLATLLLGLAPTAFAQAPAKSAKLTIEQLVDIKHPTDPLWSPDGKHVVFTWDRAGVFNLYVSNADGHGQPVPLTSFSEGQVSEAFWNRDSQTVYFPHNGDLWQVTIGGGAPRPVWTTSANESSIVPSPDGTRVAFVRRSSEIAEGEVHKSDLVVRSLADGSESVVAQDNVSITRPIWSPDGT